MGRIQVDNYKWIKYFLLVFSLLTPLILIVFMRIEYMVISFLAYLNCLLAASIMYFLLRRNNISSFLVILFLPYLLLAWPVAYLFLGFFNPDASYILFSGQMSFFENGIRLQLSVILFFMGYLPVVLFGLKGRTKVEFADKSRLIGFSYILIFFTFLIISINAVSKVINLPSNIVYIADGLFNYAYGLLFISGVTINKISKSARLFLVSFLGVMVLFYTVGNARGQAVYCILMLIFGILFFSDLSTKLKIVIVVSFLIIFPVYLTIGNTTRALLGTVGYEEGFSYRLETLKRWKEVTPEQSVVSSTFGRLFFNGGHAIIINTPENVPYKHFDPAKYTIELAESLIPGKLFYEPYYRSKWILRDYGFNITEGHGVGISMIGSFWLLGGYMFVFFGGVLLGVFHVLVGHIIEKAFYLSSAKGLLYFSIVSTALIRASGVGFITHWKLVIYRLVFAFLLYHILRLAFPKFFISKS